MDGKPYEVTDDISLDKYKQHTIEVVVDRVIVRKGSEGRLRIQLKQHWAFRKVW